jgi:hypothetical protein
MSFWWDFGLRQEHDLRMIAGLEDITDGEF